MSRVLRGGSWNNNPRNCRAANRNNNTPDNRNNNIGFRVCRGAHIVIIPARRQGVFWRVSEFPADHGFPDEAGERSMAQACPVRTRSVRRAHSKTGRHLDSLPWRPPLFAHPFRVAFSGGALPDPAAEQPADFRHHGADVRVLTIVEPLPAVRQPQVQPQPIERRVGILQRRLAACAARALGDQGRLLAIERRIHQAPGNALAVHSGKALRVRQQPAQEVEQPRE
ncbi:MAG: SUMF1/EgtB/PvdO family nonheme iron enzyme [Candidatus Accumulibacter sp.]|nr:SUMF1/EgtB/PvdO family nonheme iron enzyme [Accumulibacter sp.]